MNIIRTKTKLAGGVTPQELERLAEHTKKWIANAMSTQSVDPERLTAAIHALYAAADKKPPRVVVVPSPKVMALAGGLASAVWWIKQNPEKALQEGLTFGGAATSAATSAATDAAAEAATDATRAATDAATWAATDAATDAATRAATWDATWAAADATDAATDAATYAATRAATRAATSAATRAATRAATSAATSAAAEVATEAATRTATRDATDAATWDATWAAADATDDATYAATRAATRDAPNFAQLSKSFGVNPKFAVACAKSWYRPYQGGNMWSATPCYLSAFRDVLGLDLPEHAKFAAWEQCATEGGFRWMHDEFCIVSDRPEVLTVDDKNRPHGETGPSYKWRDGWRLYFWHGVSIPEDRSYIITDPSRITVSEIEGEGNSEMRRVLIDRYGPERYVVDSGATASEALPEDHPIKGLRTARILTKQVPDDEPIVFVDLLNSTPEPDGTTKRYMLRVDPNAYGGEAATNPHAAVASTWRHKSGELAFKRWQDYAPTQES